MNTNTHKPAHNHFTCHPPGSQWLPN